MPSTHLQFTIRRLMIVVAVVALGCALIIIALKPESILPRELYKFGHFLVICALLLGGCLVVLAVLIFVVEGIGLALKALTPTQNPPIKTDEKTRDQ